MATDPADWPAVESEARGQTVYFHAWGGEPRINAYITWAGKQLSDRHGITLKHVKLSDTAATVSAILAEKAAGRTSGGTVDLIWVNGENFNTLKTQGLLQDQSWADQLPNWQYVDVDGKPTVVSDFTVPTDGLESPWGMAQLVFMYDTTYLKAPPKSLAELASYTEANPGRFTYPQPPNFHGSTFLKQILVTLIEDKARLAQPVDAMTFDADVAPLFDYLDKLHPSLWRKAQAFPQNAGDMRRLMGDGELDIAFSFNPADASSAIANGELPDTVRSFVLDGGTIGNTHFVAIPFNSSAREAALVTANFLLSPEAQLRKQNPELWGDPTVLAINKLGDRDREAFNALDLGIATLSPQELGPTIAEPHPTWVRALEKAWAARYGGA